MALDLVLPAVGEAQRVRGLGAGGHSGSDPAGCAALSSLDFHQIPEHPGQAGSWFVRGPIFQIRVLINVWEHVKRQHPD